MKINGEVYELESIDDLTLDEAGLIEDLADQPIETMTAVDFARKKVMKAFAFIFISRQDPAFTFADAGHLRLSDFDVPDSNPEKTREPGKAKPKSKRQPAVKASTG
jgi:hypothetical protein